MAASEGDVMQSPHSTGIAFMSGKGNVHKRKAPVNGQARRTTRAGHWFDELLEAARVMQPITLTRGELELDKPLLPPKTGPEVRAGHHPKR
jgi:hypothetical protein